MKVRITFYLEERTMLSYQQQTSNSIKLLYWFSISLDWDTTLCCRKIKENSNKGIRILCHMFWIICEYQYLINLPYIECNCVLRYHILYLYTSLIYAFHIHFFVKLFSKWSYKCFYVIIRHIIIYIRVVPFFDSTSYGREKCKWNSHEKI